MGGTVFIAGGTGYIGSRLIPRLLERGYRTVALTRESSKHKLPAACECVIGDPLQGASYQDAVDGAETFVHLVGVSHPSPAKERQFVEVDLKSAVESISVAKAANVSHFVYVSVAHPAPVMQAYVNVRTKCEEVLGASGLHATILRPWYVLGPGHRWPYLLIPLYKAAERIPRLRPGAFRLGLVTIQQMVSALVYSIENPTQTRRVLDPPSIRDLANSDL
jgi:uncharacterized protein YbjT (DUF2867 family)